MADRPTEEEMVEVYRCNSELEADRILVEVLEPEGIATYVRSRASHALPAPDSEAGAYFLAVPAGDAERARELLADARDDEVIDEEAGELLP